MRFATGLACLLASTASATTASRSVTVYSWPFESSKPQSLAKIEYETQNYTATVADYTPPSAATDALIRIGLYEPKTSAWNGVVTSSSSFNGTYQGKLFLHLDSSDEVHRVSFNAFTRPLTKQQQKERERQKRRLEKKQQKGLPVAPKKSKKNAQADEDLLSDDPLLVQVVQAAAPPAPHLNRPVQLNAEGKLPHKEEEKSFLQKYWWAIAIFLVLQVVSAGGGGGGGEEGGKK